MLSYVGHGMISDRSPCRRQYCMKENLTATAYEILWQENGKWVFFAFGDDRDLERLVVPQEVLEHVRKGKPGKLTANGHLYWIRPSDRFSPSHHR
jgi:hypothetical protein